jgi:hypothetical protein
MKIERTKSDELKYKYNYNKIETNKKGRKLAAWPVASTPVARVYSLRK